MTKGNKFLRENRDNLCVKDIRSNSTSPVLGNRTVDTRDKKLQEMEEAQILVVSQFGHLINCVVPWEKRVSGDALQPDSTGGKRKHFLQDLPQRLR